MIYNNSLTIDGLTGSGRVNLAGYQQASKTLTVGAGGATSTFSGDLVNGNGSQRLTKSGSGTLTLGGNNGFRGTITVNSGTLLVDGAHTGGGATR